jgi:NAD-dependent deacetylase
MLPERVIHEAFTKSEAADVFFSIGTSALVHPAASLPMAARRNHATLIEINPDRTPISDLTDFHFSARSGELLPQLVALLESSTDAS